MESKQASKQGESVTTALVNCAPTRGWAVFFLLSLGLLLSPSPARADITTGLVGWWKLDDSTGAVDSSIYGNNGVLTGTSYVSSCARGGCRSFNGTSDYIQTGFHPFLGNFTGSVALWCYYVGGGHFISAGANGTATGFALAPRSTGFRASFYGNQNIWTTDYIFQSRVWMHMVVVKTPGPINTTTKLYINGELKQTDWNTTATPNFTQSWPLYFGREMPWAATYAACMLDDIRIYNRALTAEDVAQLYNWGKTRINNAHIANFHSR